MQRSINIVRLFVEVMAAVFIAEMGVMFILPLFGSGLGETLSAALDAGILTLIAGPIILWRVRAAVRKSVGSLAAATTGRPTSPVLAAAAALVAGLMITTGAVWITRNHARSESSAMFERLTERVASEAQRRVSLPVYGLKGAKGALAAMESVDRLGFRRYAESRNLEAEFPGVLGFGFIEPVPRGNLAEFVSRERADAAPDFAVSSTGQNEELWVVKYIDPIERNRAVWGADISSSPERLKAVVDAVLTGEPTLSAHVTLTQDPEGRSGLIYVLPVYRNGASPTTPVERREALLGVVYVPIVAELALAGVSEIADGMVSTEVFDENEISHEGLLFDSEGTHQSSGGQAIASELTNRGLSIIRTIHIGGRTWTIQMASTPKFESTVDLKLPAILSVGGAFLSLMLATVIWSLGTSKMRSVSLAKAITADLVTAKMQAEDALREVQTLRNTIDEHAIMSVTDAEGRITHANAAFCRISGYTESELLGTNHHILEVSTHHNTVWSNIWETITNGQVWKGEVCDRRKDGTAYWVESTIAPFRGEDGKIGRFIAIQSDITERRTAEEALKVAHAQADAANHAKSEFLANMSHEIRTPLTAILGYADMLRIDRETAENPQRRGEAVDTIRRAGKHLLTVINDVLDLSKIEAGRMTVERVETSTIGILHEVESLMRSRATEKGLELSTRFDTPVPESIMSDPTRLRQILMNLTGNAVKFTERGGVSVIVRVTTVRPEVPDERDEPRVTCQQSEPYERLVIDVTDTGPGMTEAQASTLFRPFTQSDTTVTRKHGGTGLGLTICRRLAELMGGTVELASSQPGRRSTFRADLPLEMVPGSVMVDRMIVMATEVASEQKSADVSVSDGPGTGVAPPAPVAAETLVGRILLAEDGADNQRLITFHLKRAGAVVEVADNGKLALDRLLAADAAGEPFDLLVTDMQMPEMDGYTLASTLRSSGHTIPIIALTAHAMAEDQRRCISAGCSAYATKPIDRPALIAVCSKWLKWSAQQRSERPAAA